jgi:hypothetical protein
MTYTIAIRAELPKIYQPVDARDIMGLMEFAVDLNTQVDAIYRELGALLASHAPADCKVALDLFKAPVSDATNGVALFEIERVAEAIRETRDEFWSDPRGWTIARTMGVS